MSITKHSNPIDPFATASRWRKRMVSALAWLIILSLGAGVFMLYAWYQQHKVNRLVEIIPKNTVLYLSVSQGSLGENESLIEQYKMFLPIQTPDWENLQELLEDVRYFAWVLTKTDNQINRHLLLQCATFNCAEQFFNQYPDQAKNLGVLLVAVSFDEPWVLDDNIGIKNLPADFHQAEAALYVDIDWLNGLLSSAKDNFFLPNMNNDLLLVFKQSNGRWDFKSLTDDHFSNFYLESSDYQLTNSTVLFLDHVPVSVLFGFDNEDSEVIEKLGKIFGSDHIELWHNFLQTFMAWQIIIDPISGELHSAFVFLDTPLVRQAFDNLFPQWMAYHFPTIKDHYLPDGTLATHLVSDIQSWQQNVIEDKISVLANKEHDIKLFIVEVGDKLAISYSQEVIKELLSADGISFSGYQRSCSNNSTVSFVFLKPQQLDGWPDYLPEFLIANKKGSQPASGCLFIVE